MRIACISQPRTRSTHFCNVISNHYQISNFNEKYMSGSAFSIRNSCHTLNILKKQKTDEIYKRLIKEKTKSFFNDDKFILKIFPKYFITNEFFCDFSSKDLIHELDLYFKLKSYDKIYVLTRESLTDNVCSFMYSSKFNSWHQNPSMNIINDPITLLNSYSLAESHLNETVIERVLLNKLKEYFHKNNIDYLELVDDEISNYLKNNFKLPRINMLPTNRNFKEIILDYQEVENMVNLKYLEFSERLKDFQFI